jgi:hypothetical protein
VTLNGSALAARQATRAARAHPLIALGVAALLATVGRQYARAVQQRAKAVLVGVTEQIAEDYGRAQQQHRSGQVVWLQAERGEPGTQMLYRVAWVLACHGPLTRTEILHHLDAVPAGYRHRELMDDLYRMLREFPMFCEVSPGRWQVGRRGVDFATAIDA